MISEYPKTNLTDTQLRAAPVKTTDRDFAGRQNFNTVFGEAVVGWRNDDVSVMFQYNNSTRDVTQTVTGSGVITNSTEQASVALGTGVGSAVIASKAPIRYRPGHEAVSQFTSMFIGAQSGVNQYHGMLNGVDGITFGTKDGVFGTWFIEGGVETFTPRSSWIGDKLDGTGPSGFILDFTKVNIYMVSFGWLGVAPIIYSIYTGPTFGWVVCHSLDKVNTGTTPHINNPSLPISVKVSRASGTGTIAEIRTSSWRGGVVGGSSETAADRWFAHTVLNVSIAAGLTRNNVFTIKNTSTFQGKTNHVVMELAIVTFDNAGNKTVAFFGTKNAELVGASAYVDVDSTNSISAISTGGTIVGGLKGPATVVKAGGDRRTEVKDTGILLYPGETFTFEAIATTFTGDISLSARWVEYF
jgi:hypothetical protein